MSDVREASAPTINHEDRTGPNPTGDFIWYELMTTGVDAAKDLQGEFVADLGNQPIAWTILRRRDAVQLPLVLIGIVLFSGSLYLLTFGAPRFMGIITPVGGLALIAGWTLFAVTLWRQ